MGYISAKIVYGYPFYKDEVDWDFTEKEFCKDEKSDFYYLEDYFFKIVLEDMCFTCFDFGIMRDDQLIFGDELFGAEGVAQIDLDKIKSYANEEVKERITENFKKFFPYLPDREPGFYLVTECY